MEEIYEKGRESGLNDGQIAQLIAAGLEADVKSGMISAGDFEQRIAEAEGRDTGAAGGDNTESASDTSTSSDNSSETTDSGTTDNKNEALNNDSAYATLASDQSTIEINLNGENLVVETATNAAGTKTEVAQTEDASVGAVFANPDTLEDLISANQSAIAEAGKNAEQLDGSDIPRRSNVEVDTLEKPAKEEALTV